ncbi:Crp/Fnr family transcriptional regulator [Listeria costaricensis]|uniref:Crp/Fnr family transcriptional regulator n=1 Tax=Listeria costaricensis TaxID=2026604 RepID=UPI001968B7BA|nr:Crp/Fnr family transcriptional regulator [Listeria costaricensis]
MVKKEHLREKWQQYGNETIFNYSKIQAKLTDEYPEVCFEPNEKVVVRGDFPVYIYFIISGILVGVRDYEDGNEYEYFQLGQQNGSIGLLELLAKKEQMVATVTCLSKVKAVRVPADVVYEWIMEDMELLRLSANLLAVDLYHCSNNSGLFYRFEGVDRLRYFLAGYYEEQVRVEKGIVEVSETREKIGNKLGMSVRTVGRSLKKLRDNQEIINKERKIYIGPEEHQRLKQHFIQS